MTDPKQPQPITGDNIGGDNIAVGNIENSNVVAVGAGATAVSSWLYAIF